MSFFNSIAKFFGFGRKKAEQKMSDLPKETKPVEGDELHIPPPVTPSTPQVKTEPTKPPATLETLKVKTEVSFTGTPREAWVKAHGKPEKGMIVTFKRGDKKVLSNLEVITRAEHMARNAAKGKSKKDK